MRAFTFAKDAYLLLEILDVARNGDYLDSHYVSALLVVGFVNKPKVALTELLKHHKVVLRVSF